MTTVSFESFWPWLVQHPGCLIRVATVDAVLHDYEDLHWYLGPEEVGLVVQVIRGKRLMGEVLLDPSRVSYVHVRGEEREGEHHFELISESETGAVAIYTFVLSHGMTEEETEGHRQAVH